MRPRLLPILIATAVLTLTVRIGELGQAEMLPSFAGPDDPFAEETGETVEDLSPEDIPVELLESVIVPQAGGEMAGDDMAGEDMGQEGTEEASDTPKPAGDGMMAKAEGMADGGSPDTDNDGSIRDPFSLTDTEIELLQRLAERRAEIDREAAAIEERRILLEAAESRVDQKLEELKSLQTMIKELLDRHDEKEEEQLQSLVRIYESMKPKDAARIFEQLDMPVLLEVIGRMKERKTAPVLALMDPERAKAITLELANRQALPIARE